MDVKIQETIEKLKALALDGDSHGNLSSICATLYKPEFGWTIGACEMLRDVLVGMLEQLDPDEWSNEYLDEVGLMRLPKDADGEVIHVGDDLCIYGERRRCTSLTLRTDEWEVNTLTSVHSGELNEVHHYHASTIEEVLREMIDEVRQCCDTENTITEYAAKLRELMADE